jgi:putative acetyltransferase
MFVVPSGRGRGIAQALLARVEAEARDAGFRVLRLETGDAQDAALRLYRRWGFADCGAFGPYARMPRHAVETSIFLEKRLDEEATALNARISTT